MCFVTTNHARGSQLMSGAWNLVSDDELIAGSTYVCKIYTLCEMLASIVISLDGTGKALRRTIASFRTGTLHDIRHKVLLWKGSFGYMPIFFTCVRKMHAEGRKGILISSSLINVRRESLVKTTRRFHNSALMLLSSLRLLSDGMQCSTTS